MCVSGILFLLFQGYVWVRLYWLSSCVIPTYSMSPTLIEGDYIVANLQIPGRRVLKENANGDLTVCRKEGFGQWQREMSLFSTFLILKIRRK